MKRKLTFLSMIGLTTLCAVSITGCGMTTENAQEYADAVVQIYTTGEYDGDVKNTDISERDQQGTYQYVLESIVDAQYLNEIYDADDTTVQEFSNFIEKALPLCKYEVGEAESSDDGYTVAVTFYPLDLYANVDQAAVCNEVLDKLEAGEISDDELYSTYFQRLIEKAEYDLTSPSYADAENVEFTIVKGDNGKYGLSEDFILDIASLIENPYPDLHDVFDDDGWNTRYAQIFTKSSLELLLTGNNSTGIEFDDVSREEYSELYNSIINESLNAESLQSEYGLSDSTIQTWKDLLGSIYTYVRYEIGEAQKTEDGYSVAVTVWPIDLSAMVDEETITNQLSEKYMNGELTEDQLYDQFYVLLADQINQSLANPVYRDPVTISMDVSKSSDTYEITEESGEIFGNNAIYFEM